MSDSGIPTYLTKSKQAGATGKHSPSLSSPHTHPNPKIGHSSSTNPAKRRLHDTIIKKEKKKITPPPPPPPPKSKAPGGPASEPPRSKLNAGGKFY